MKFRWLACLSACIIAGSEMPVIGLTVPQTTQLNASLFRVFDENLVYIGADYLNPASVLFDDQDKVPEYGSSSVSADVWAATDRSHNWKPNWQAEYGDDAFYIDLGAYYQIEAVKFLDTNGVQDWTIECGEPFAWHSCGSFTTDAYHTWREVSCHTGATRYLRFTAPCGDAGVCELALFGYRDHDISEAEKLQTGAKAYSGSKTNLTAGQRIGFNAFIDDPMTAIMAAGNVREYHNLSWLFDDEGKIKFTQGTWGDMDSYYAAMHARGISVIPCFQGNSPVIYGSEKPPEIACAQDADTTDPVSYTMHAQAMYQVAARYGSNTKVDPKTLNVSAGSEPKVGLGFLGAAENSNEPNKTWSGKASFYSPFEMAAMCSADYDGHCKTIANAGVKQADPNFKLAVGGLLMTGSLLDYLSEMKLWFDYNRPDGKFAVDIINVHLGPDAPNPEDSGFVQRIQVIQDWIEENIPGTELWISEFEIPMSDCEKEGVDSHDNELYQLRYAQRVARTYLLAIGAGVDRMTKFQLRDEDEGVYYNSGLVTGKGSWSKKLAWYYTACMTNVLKNADFVADRSADGVCNYEFLDRVTGDTIYCLWLPTNADKTVKGYHLDMPRNGYPYLTVPCTYAEGTVSELPANMRSIAVDVSETPVFVTVCDKPQQIINGKGVYIAPKQLCLLEDGSGEICDLKSAPKDSKLNQFYRMFDEPDSMPQVIYGDTAELAAPETDVTGSNMTCYVTLPQQSVMTGFGVYDTFGTGGISVYDAYTDTLIWSSDLGSYMSRSISLLDGSVPTDLLKIVKEGGALNELAIYGYAVPEKVEGDVNADGTCSIADAVALQKWLITEAKSLADWSAGDLNCDGKLNAVDLSLLKGLLLQAGG